jgi:hypothetical protein
MTFLGGWAASHVQSIVAFFLTKQGLVDLPEQQNLLVPSGEWGNPQQLSIIIPFPHSHPIPTKHQKENGKGWLYLPKNCLHLPKFWVCQQQRATGIVVQHNLENYRQGCGFSPKNMNLSKTIWILRTQHLIAKLRTLSEAPYGHMDFTRTNYVFAKKGGHFNQDNLESKFKH